MARYLPFNDVLVDAAGKLTKVWQDLVRSLSSDLDTARTTLATVPGVNYFTIATQPSLGASDVGYVGYEKDTGHYVWFDGTNWQLLGSGDAPGEIRDFAITAPSVGWVLCDGTATTYLVVGAPTLSTTAFTTPNLTGTPAYRKSAAAYTGTINAKAGSTGTGTTGTGTTGTGTTGTGTTGTDTTGSSTDTVTTGGPSAFYADGVFQSYSSGVFIDPPSNSHTHSGTTAGHSHTVPGLSVPGLSVPGLSVPGLSVPALAVGTIEMANLGMLPYFRR